MRRLIVVFLLVISFGANAATFKQAQNIYNRIVILNNIQAPPLVLNRTSEVNADETDRRIAVNAGMLRFVHNESELALVLGHELGHYVLHHQTSNVRNEFAADHQGAIFMSNAGYNRCLGAKIFLRFPPVPKGSDHPDNMDRIKQLGC
jgi:predicted Zn-dependent protease